MFLLIFAQLFLLLGGLNLNTSHVLINRIDLHYNWYTPENLNTSHVLINLSADKWK